jgi:hypothetical protein
MKKTYLLLLLFIAPLSSFANEQIDIESSAINIEMWETFTITISLSNLRIEESKGKLSLPWIENFNIFSQGTSNIFQDINGETQSVTQLVIDLQAKQAWEFAIWPVEIIWDEILRDNEKINITVAWNPTPTPQPIIWGNPSSEDTKKQDQIEDISSSKESWTVSGLREINFPLWAHWAFIIFFITSFYILLRYVLSGEKKAEIESLITQDWENNTNHSRDYFMNLAEEIGTVESGEFFHQYNIWMRNIFSKLWVQSSKTVTLTELSRDTSISSRDEFLLFKKSYKHEYSAIEISEQTQKIYIDDILTLIKK